MTDEVLSEVRGRAGVITLNRPQAMNALTHPMALEVARVLDRWRDDDSVEVVVLAGAGDRGLCAGGDVVALRDDALAGGHAGAGFWRDEYTLNLAIDRYPKPYVALMTGVVLGGGIGLSAHGSHRVVTEDTRAGMPETGIGFVPDVGGSWLLARAGALGLHLALTGQHIGPAETIEAGMADVHVPREHLSSLVEELCHTGDADVVSRYASAASPSFEVDRTELAATYDGADLLEILSRLDGLGPGWAADAAKRLRRNCPTALAVTLAHVRRAAGLDLAAALDAEFAVSLHLQRRGDFAEGIRAQLVDKDRQPRWDPATLDDVDPAQVEAILGPLDDPTIEPLRLADDPRP
ncbi:3-hydroxyisobutyryl-CoA hydrolase [Acidipropionibacterium timonense]|uniref:3-hydroxyisobutyryl-CoA hydrolase n=1 Tax=Acidipropionibacterium timonense TaxID=2161818 RepID=UPI00103260E4|nr:3-hydroxyisobutyryl-CoA hydrolase [Acidipropionibacterium timonense]